MPTPAASLPPCPVVPPPDLLARLYGCLAELDQLGAQVAAAHLAACLDALHERFNAERDTSKTE